VAALAAAAVLLGRGRVERACAALGVGSVVAATIAIVGLGFSVYASGGVRLPGGVVRAAVAVAVGSGLGGALLGLAQWRRVESALAS